MKHAIALGIGLLALAAPAAAESPVAIVEEVQGKVTGAEFMDYLTPKAVIKLGANSSVVISYLKITGCKLALIINFCVRNLTSGIRRIAL